MNKMIWTCLAILCIHFLHCEKEKITTLEDLTKEERPSENELINQSLTFYDEGKFLPSIRACEKAIEINPDNKMAWNNLCCAYTELENWNKAIRAGEKALEIDPSFELARNNLDYARENLSDSSKVDMPDSLSVNEYINKSLDYYEQGNYLASIKACQKVLAKDQNHAVAYNNICAAYNALEQWQKALKYCEKAVELDKNSEHAINNLDYVRENMRTRK